MSGTIAAQVDQPDELELAQAAAGGDPEARRELVLRLLTPVRNTARYLISNDHDADDVAQTALVEVLRSLRSFRGESSLGRWASRITVRCALAWIKRRQREAKVIQLVPDAAELSGGGAVDAATALAVRHRLALCLDGLKDERRVTVVLRFVQGYTLREIAEVMEVPQNTVKDRLRIGRQELRARVLRDPVFRSLRAIPALAGTGGDEP